MSSAKWRPFCLGLNVLIAIGASNTEEFASLVVNYCVSNTMVLEIP